MLPPPIPEICSPIPEYYPLRGLSSLIEAMNIPEQFRRVPASLLAIEKPPNVRIPIGLTPLFRFGLTP